ncbi:hypothetical protein ACFQJ5_02270 [Halomicroarcula sp. GCM10025324]|uniref:hypothetical protein n=1 Tax=Haloarcula TaxID=2237 RepID=UPI0023E7A75C|nr:hypothetical protein [Halomicroarcula sp. ZS-22-S1]
MSRPAPLGSLLDSLTGVRSLATAVTRGPLQGAAFWTGVVAPLAYPLFLFGELDSQSLVLLLGVVVLNVGGLLLGRGYADRC